MRPQIDVGLLQHALIIHNAQQNHKRSCLDLVTQNGLPRFGYWVELS